MDEYQIEAVTRLQKTLNNELFVIIVPALFGLGGAALSIRFFGQYGWSLFLALPGFVSFLSAFAWSYKQRRTFKSAYGNSLLSIMTLGVFILIFAIDGFICLLMALPLTLVMALLGTWLGLSLGTSYKNTKGTTFSLLLCASFPLLVSFEKAITPEPFVREVTTSVVIDAPIPEVWETVIAFPKITAAPEGIFRLGIAYPIEARIEGAGVGAIRYCTFSTGDFVEPITEWDAPNRLSFDVRENPVPMKESSFYRDLDVPHLHNFMVSKKGRFQLVEQNGQVRLEGTTWYSHSLAPEFYWGLISDEIIHRVHRRVLDRIKQHAEGGN